MSDSYRPTPANSLAASRPAGGDIQAVLDAASRFAEVRAITIPDPNGKLPDVPVAAVPSGVTLAPLKGFLDPYRLTPERRRGTAVLHDLPSFTAHVLRYKGADSVLFASPDAASARLTAVFNYHPEGGDTLDAGWGDHRAEHPCVLSDEWTAWSRVNDSPQSQAAFAEFLEDRLEDIGPPVTASPVEGEGEGEARRRVLLASLGGACADRDRLMALARGFKVNVSDSIVQAQNLQTGEVQLVYQSEHRDEGNQPVKVPQLFIIEIPVWQFGPLYRIAVRLRYRVKESNGRKVVVWITSLHRADLVFRHAYEELCSQAVKDTGLPLFVGTPE